MKSILNYIYIFLFCYSIPAFVNFDFNAGNWSKYARFFVVGLFIVIGIIYEAVKDTRK